MRSEGKRFPGCRRKAILAWPTAICFMAASCAVLLFTLAAFGMTSWLNETSPTWEKRLDAGLVLWIVLLNASTIFLLPACMVSGLNPMRILNTRGAAWPATLPVLVMGLGLLTSAVATSLAALSETLAMAMAHWLTLLNITNAMAGVTVCISLWVGNRFQNASRDWLASRGNGVTLIVVALLCLAFGTLFAALIGFPGRWVPAVVAATIMQTTVAMPAAWSVWQIGKRTVER